MGVTEEEKFGAAEEQQTDAGDRRQRIELRSNSRGRRVALIPRGYSLMEEQHEHVAGGVRLRSRSPRKLKRLALAYAEHW